MNKLLENTSTYQFSKDIPSFLSLYPVLPDHANSQKDDEYSPYGLIEFEKHLRTPSGVNEEHGKGNHLANSTLIFF